MDAGRQDEEGHRQQQRCEQDPAQVVAARDQHHGQQRHGGEEQRPDLLPVEHDRSDDQRHAAVVAALERVAKPAPRIPPQVERIDREALVGVGGLEQLADQAPVRVRGRQDPEHPMRVAAGERRIDDHAERQHQQGQRADPHRQRGEDAEGVAMAVELGVARAAEEVAPQADDGDDRDQECELELDEERDDGAEGRHLDPATRQRVDGRQQDEGADRVDLAPDRGDEDGGGVEQVHAGRQQAKALRADADAGALDQLATPPPADHEQQPRDANVRQDARDFHQADGRVLSDHRRQRLADRAEHPEHVHVARRVIAEVARLIECAWPYAC